MDDTTAFQQKQQHIQINLQLPTGFSCCCDRAILKSFYCRVTLKTTQTRFASAASAVLAVIKCDSELICCRLVELYQEFFMRSLYLTFIEVLICDT